MAEFTDIDNGTMAKSELPLFAGSSAALYGALIAPGTFGVVAAETGGGKTLLLCNLAAHALMQGKRVGVVCMDVGKATITDRMKWILGDVPTTDATSAGISHELATAVVQALAAIKWMDYSATGATPAQLSLDLPDIAGGVDVLLVDGIDAVDPQFGKAYDIEAVAALLAKLAADMPHLTIWTTSQIKVQASGTEIVRLDDLALTAAKGHRGALVVTLGQRVPGLLWTACVVKDRNRQASAERQVYRLALRPSLRLELLPIKGAELPYADEPAFHAPFEFLGPDEDLPSDDKDCRDGGDGGGDVDDDEEAQHPSRTWHGKNGFVAIGRAVFNSDMWLSQQYQYAYWLMELYARAHPIPDPKVMCAPGTNIAVRVFRGELMVSVPMLAKLWRVKEKPVRTFLKHMQQAGLIKISHITATGKRVEASDSAEGTSTGSSTGASKRIVAQVIIPCHYSGKTAKSYSDEEAQGHVDGHVIGHARGA
jgi:hypothetical protein